MESKPTHCGETRRDFCAKACSVVIGGAISLVPAAAGVAVYLDPVRRTAEAGTLARVTTLDSLPFDGTPMLFPVIATRVDAWNRTTAPIGAVYVRRLDAKKLVVFNVTCPHAGCAVEFKPENSGYHCPCHDSTFTVDGKRSEDSPAARDLDTLDYEIRANGEVWVKFQNFQTGHEEKTPVA